MLFSPVPNPPSTIRIGIFLWRHWIRKVDGKADIAQFDTMKNDVFNHTPVFQVLFRAYDTQPVLRSWQH